MEYYIVGAVIGLIAIALISSIRKAKRERERTFAGEFSDIHIFDRVVTDFQNFGKEAQREHRLQTIENQIALLLDHLGLEYKIEPAAEAKPVLVKKTKERG